MNARLAMACDIESMRDLERNARANRRNRRLNDRRRLARKGVAL